MSSKKNTASSESVTPSTLVPKLRFPEFDGSGEWHSGCVGDIAISESSTLALSKLTLVSDGYPVYGADGCVGLIDSFNQTEDYIAIVKDGSGVGRLSMKKGNSSVLGTLAYIKSNPKSNAVLAWLFYCLNSLDLRPYVKGSGIPHIYFSDYSCQKVFVPNESEQQRIASCLSTLDELITAQTQKVEALKTHKKGLMQQLFPHEGETQPRLRFPEFEGEWEESPLSDFILTLDAGVSVNSHDRPATTAEFGVLKTSAVTNGVFEPEENKVVWEESEQSRLKESVRGDTIIISRMNTPALVGANAYVASSHENLFLPDRLWAAKPQEGVSLRFIAFILGSERGRSSLSKLAKGSSGSMKNITKPEVLALTLMAPMLPEQQRIASCLSSLDELITNESNKLDVYKTHKKGLMQQLFPSIQEN